MPNVLSIEELLLVRCPCVDALLRRNVAAGTEKYGTCDACHGHAYVRAEYADRYRFEGGDDDKWKCRFCGKKPSADCAACHGHRHAPPIMFGPRDPKPEDFENCPSSCHSCGGDGVQGPLKNHDWPDACSACEGSGISGGSRNGEYAVRREATGNHFEPRYRVYRVRYGERAMPG